MRTYSTKPGAVPLKWRVIDAAGQAPGRLASQIAQVLRGKDKPVFSPHLGVGDYVVVINAAKVRVTGKKAQDKKYRWFTGYPGGLRERTFEQMVATHPERIIERAVKGMLPRGPLGYMLLQRLKVYPGADHPHQSQVAGGIPPQREVAAALKARFSKAKSAPVAAPAAATAPAPATAAAPAASPTPPPGRPVRRRVKTLEEREATRKKPAEGAPRARRTAKAKSPKASGSREAPKGDQ
ncbi:MAG: 50S ribosomal protein L13 [Chloroflexi bacterium]|nr:50S ribosomal protein L13 [Chloroflexota bacterium]